MQLECLHFSYFFKKAGHSEEFRVQDLICNLKPSTLSTYSKHPNEKGIPIGTTAAFLEGTGVVDYTVHDSMAPRMGMRVGVGCGFGDCGGRG
ncbi:hypothetical protein OESDEN_14422 [Oesophagostomum dentatum]|uniref:Uncharacterized protein n=1 Tax=Oesophagostomum dentatum TaxID=61180 RepID=A0A0B1SQN8_OESDE|nr:hypothetical protein OESDEN_14422 [Oesophagostomum dentatum]